MKGEKHTGRSDCEYDFKGASTGDSWGNVDVTKENQNGTGPAGTLVHELSHMRDCVGSQGKQSEDMHKGGEKRANETEKQVMKECEEDPVCRDCLKRANDLLGLGPQGEGG